MENIIELKILGEERAKERFPKMKIQPTRAWWSGGTYYVIMYVDNGSVVGTGKSMNECCDSLIKDIERITAPEYNPEKVELL